MGKGLQERSQLGQSAIVNASLVAMMWVLELVDQLTRGLLDRLGGIEPRQFGDLYTVLTAPWLHVGWGHLIGNTVPFFVLGLFIAASSWREWIAATAWAVVGSGAAVWLFSPPYSITLGASGLIFGWFGYLALRGFLTKEGNQIAISVLVLLMYGGLLLGLLPNGGSSWQGHLGGLAGGLLAAWMMHRRPATSTRTRR